MAQSGSSISAFVTTLIVNGILFAVFISIFVCFKQKQKRVYEPRATVDTVDPIKKPDSQPKGAFAWFDDLLHKPESYSIQQAGPDGYFFLRYLFNFVVLSLVGGVVCWVILFPVNTTNSNKSAGKNVNGFDILGFVNVRNKYRYFAHAFVSWIFFGLVVYVIYRELVYYTSFRHALQATPLYDSLLSSRTLLITTLPEKYQDEEGLRTLFPLAQNIWFARDHKDLEKLVKERTKLSGKYEAAMNKVINKSMKLRAKAIKKNKEVPAPENELAAYIPEKKMPTHKLKFLIGEKVKTLNYAPEHLGELNQEIGDKQASYTTAEKVGSAFLEFPSQLEAQRAYQAMPYIKELKKSQTIINAAPEDIVWENCGTSYYVRHTKSVLAKTMLTLTIIFWSIPVAVVGCISNINYLIEIVPWMGFIDNLPKVLLGLITGLLPTIMLAVLMSLLPPWIRKWGKVSGCLTVQDVEKWTQSWYFGFQVVQVFIVTTLASAASSVVKAIIDKPGSAMTLLSQYLPRLSNFYIPYMLLQGLSVPSGALAQLVPLILAQFLGKILDNTPRKQWNRYNTLGKPSWGTLYPLYQLMAVILLVYAIIAPIIIVFSVITFLLIYIAFSYNLTYVMDQNVDSRGRLYPKALFQTFVGVYLGEVCLLGLFITAKTWGPLVLEIILLVATVLAHLYYQYRFFPILDAVPISALKGGEGYNTKDQGLKEVKETGKSFFVSSTSDTLIINNNNDETIGGGDSSSNLKNLEQYEEQSEADQGAPTFASDKQNPFEQSQSQQQQQQQVGNESVSEYTGGKQAGAINTVPEVDHSDIYTNNGDDEKGLINRNQYHGPSTLQNNLPVNATWFKRFVKPTTYSTYYALASLLPDAYQSVVSYTKENKSIYVDPAVSDEAPQLWIPRDPFGLSTAQIELAHKHGVEVTDENATIDEQLKISYHGPPPDYEEAVKH